MDLPLSITIFCAVFFGGFLTLSVIVLAWKLIELMIEQCAKPSKEEAKRWQHDAERALNDLETSWQSFQTELRKIIPMDPRDEILRNLEKAILGAPYTSDSECFILETLGAAKHFIKNSPSTQAEAIREQNKKLGEYERKLTAYKELFNIPKRLECEHKFILKNLRIDPQNPYNGNSITLQCPICGLEIGAN